MTRAHPPLPASILVTDFARNLDPFEQTAQLRQSDALILRHYELERREREQLAHTLAAMCKAKGARLLIADDHQLALRVGADGVHLPRWSLARAMGAQIRRRPSWLITASVHTHNEAISANKSTADAVIISPLFETESHRGTRGLGIVRAAHLISACEIPAYGMGGVRWENWRRVRALPLYGIAGTRTD